LTKQNDYYKGWLRFGFEFESGQESAPRSLISVGIGGKDYFVNRARFLTLALPWWFLTLLFSIAPLRAIWKWKRSRRYPPHACQSCGYDLRSTPDPAGPLLARCPECGRDTPNDKKSSPQMRH
jgi:hypothetical protein